MKEDAFSLIPDPPQEAVDMAKKLKRLVGRYYSVLESSFDEKGFYFTVILDKKTHPDNFEALRLALKKMNMFPRVVSKEGEWVIAIFRYPERGRYSIRVNILLLALTVFTTFWAGAILWEDYWGGSAGALEVLTHPRALLYGGLSFGLPLMAILGTHELGHYFVSRRHNVDASLPFFIPIPPLIAPFGTFGALISVRENIPNRRALVEIGAAGPIVGFMMALPVIYIGLKLSTKTLTADELSGMHYIINLPLIFYFFLKFVPLQQNAALHPTAIAGWIGVFVTALNLLPMGQLDGGHIVRGVFGERAKQISLGFIFILLILSFTTGFLTYLFFVLLVFLFGLIHPPPLDDISPLRGKQRIVAFTALLLFLLSFHPVPIYVEEFKPPHYSFEIQYTSNVTYLLPGEVEEVSFTLYNTGNEPIDIEIGVWGAYYTGGELNWTSWPLLKGTGIDVRLEDLPEEVTLKVGERRTLRFTAEAAPGNITREALLLEMNFTSERAEKNITERFWILASPIRVTPSTKDFIVHPGNGIRYNLTVKNLARFDLSLSINVTGRWGVLEMDRNITHLTLGPGEERGILITIFTSDSWSGEKECVEIAMRDEDGRLLGLAYAVLKAPGESKRG